MMLINQGQAAAGVPGQRGEAVQQGWVAYFLLSCPHHCSCLDPYMSSLDCQNSLLASLPASWLSLKVHPAHLAIDVFLKRCFKLAPLLSQMFNSAFKTVLHGPGLLSLFFPHGLPSGRSGIIPEPLCALYVRLLPASAEKAPAHLPCLLLSEFCVLVHSFFPFKKHLFCASRMPGPMLE